MRYYPPPGYGRPRLGCFPVFAVLLVSMGIVFCVYLTRATGYNPFDFQAPLSPQYTYSVTLHAHPLTDSHVMHSPSLTANFIDRILTLAHSPAQGTGQAMYDLSKQYGIDDAFALAFFQHESAFGTTGVAAQTRSLGNIRCSAGYPCVEGYRAYPTWVAGYQDWYALIFHLYVTQWHLTTVETIIPTYAPANENDVAGYIRAVLTAVTNWRKGQVQA